MINIKCKSDENLMSMMDFHSPDEVEIISCEDEWRSSVSTAHATTVMECRRKLTALRRSSRTSFRAEECRSTTTKVSEIDITQEMLIGKCH